MNIFNDSSDSDVEPFSEDLIPPAARLEAQITETNFDGLLTQPLKLHQDLSKGCGGKIWQAGNILANYVLQSLDIEKVRGKKIVELGAGGGLVGLDFLSFKAAGPLSDMQLSSLALASKFDSCDFDLYITDQEPMIGLMKRNADLNQLSGRVKVELLNWGDPIPASIASSPVDIVLAADCVYFEPAFPLLEQTL